MSSATANDAKKALREEGTRFPNRERTARAKAISVAIGMAIPLLAGASWHTSRKNRTGIIIPPMAPTTGKTARRSVESSPTKPSCFISNPTWRKKSTISTSLVKSRRVMVSPA